nr:uncharacterized protein LOC126518944 [Dermacentor andersoni]
MSLLCDCYNLLSGSRKMPMIGENVTMDAYVVYDDTYMSSSDDKLYANNLFKEVESYLHNHSIMINITVKETLTSHNLTVYFEPNKSVDGHRTLENLTKYGESMQKANNSIFFLFYWARNPKDVKTADLIDHIQSPGSHRLGVSEVSTTNSFCTKNTSAAVIRHRPESRNFWSTAEAILNTFGSQHFIYFTDDDWRNMNETFSRCPHKEELGDFPKC